MLLACLLSVLLREAGSLFLILSPPTNVVVLVASKLTYNGDDRN